MGTRSLDPPLGDAQRPGRVEKAVEKEIRRRKRLLIVYGSLLIIPIAVASLYVKTGVTDQELVTRQVEPIRRTLSQVEPALAQVRTADARLSQQQARIDSLQEKQSAMFDRIQPVASRVDELNQRVSGISADLSRQRDLFAGVQQTASSAAARDAEIRAQLAALANTQQQMTRRQEAVESQVHALNQRITTVPPTNFNELLQRQNEVIRQLQSDVQRLQQNQLRERTPQERERQPVRPPGGSQ
jgi:uncharacterized protein YoxC